MGPRFWVCHGTITSTHGRPLLSVVSALLFLALVLIVSWPDLLSSGLAFVITGIVSALSYPIVGHVRIDYLTPELSIVLPLVLECVY